MSSPEKFFEIHFSIRDYYKNDHSSEGKAAAHMSAVIHDQAPFLKKLEKERLTNLFLKHQTKKKNNLIGTKQMIY